MPKKQAQGTLRKFGKTYHVQFYDPTTGKKTSKSLKTTDKREATKKAKAVMAQVALLNESASESSMLKNAVIRETARIEHEVSQSQAKRAMCSFIEFIKFAGNIPLKRITKTMLEQYQTKRLKTVAKSTWIMDLHFIRHMLMENGIIIEKLKPAKGKKTIVRAFTRDELPLVFNHVTDRQRALYASLLFTGARPTEFVQSNRSKHLPLLKKEVDLENDTVLVRTAKGHRGESKRPRRITIPSAVSELLAAQMKQTPGPHVFLPCSNLARNFDAMLKRAGIPKFNELGEKLVLHSFRHTFGTLQANQGLHGMILMDVLGHSQASTTQRYIDAGQSAAPILNIPLDLRPHTQSNGCEKEKDSGAESAEAQ